MLGSSLDVNGKIYKYIRRNGSWDLKYNISNGLEIHCHQCEKTPKTPKPISMEYLCIKYINLWRRRDFVLRISLTVSVLFAKTNG